MHLLTKTNISFDLPSLLIELVQTRRQKAHQMQLNSDGQVVLSPVRQIRFNEVVEEISPERSDARKSRPRARATDGGSTPRGRRSTQTRASTGGRGHASTGGCGRSSSGTRGR